MGTAAYCKSICDDQNDWQQMESFINKRTGSEFSHSVCPDCYNRVVRPEIEKMKAAAAAAAPSKASVTSE